MPDTTPQPARRLDASAIFLIVANLIPVWGVLVWGWEVFPLMLVFWLENLVVGCYNAARILTARPAEPMAWPEKLFLVVFFCLHYGFFTAGHGAFVLALFGQGYESSGLPSPALVLELVRDQNLYWPVAALFLSHGYSFFANYLGHGEYRHARPQTLMSRPYRRIIVMHVALIASGVLVNTLDAPIVGLLLLIGLKTAMDFYTHTRTHASEQVHTTAS